MIIYLCFLTLTKCIDLARDSELQLNYSYKTKTSLSNRLEQKLRSMRFDEFGHDLSNTRTMDLIKPIGHNTNNGLINSSIKRNLSGKDLTNEITDTKPSKKNGIKLLILLLFVVVIFGGCLFINRKMREYINNDETVMITHHRKGRLELYTGQKFKKFKDDPRDNLDTMSFEQPK